MHLAFQTHWLETAIGDNRSPAALAQAIVNHPEFQTLLVDSISFAQQNAATDAQQTRLIAEHIVSRLYNSIGDFTTMH